MYLRPYCFLLAMLTMATSLPGETWVRGALTVHEVSDAVTITQLGGESSNLGPGDVPRTMPALFDCAAPHASTAFFSASNRSYLAFEGSGSFAVERFEQVLPRVAAWQAGDAETGQSRLIVNLRSGRLAVDNRAMAESSQFLLETPVGRITARRGLWLMRIEFDPRSQIFDFTIACSEGRVRFTDLQGQQYTLRTGQRLSGAGARNTPSIEVGENTERVREQLLQFRTSIERYASAASDLQVYQPHLEVMPDTAGVPRVSTVTPAVSDDGRRPIVIDHAKDAPPVTPFRGEIRPPSAYQADIF